MHLQAQTEQSHELTEHTLQIRFILYSQTRKMKKNLQNSNADRKTTVGIPIRVKSGSGVRVILESNGESIL